MDISAITNGSTTLDLRQILARLLDFHAESAVDWEKKREELRWRDELDSLTRSVRM